MLIDGKGRRSGVGKWLVPAGCPCASGIAIMAEQGENVVVSNRMGVFVGMLVGTKAASRVTLTNLYHRPCSVLHRDWLLVRSRMIFAASLAEDAAFKPSASFKMSLTRSMPSSKTVFC